MTPISSFTGEYRWLSNFWSASVVYDGAIYPTVEHAYQAAKTFDQLQRESIRRATSPGIAKRAGRRVDIRDDWEAAKLGIMQELVRQKFMVPDLRTKLLNTGDAPLIEGNYWGDTFWGVCRGKGHNHLGRILMSVRAALRDSNDCT